MLYTWSREKIRNSVKQKPKKYSNPTNDREEQPCKVFAFQYKSIHILTTIYANKTLYNYLKKNLFIKTRKFC